MKSAVADLAAAGGAPAFPEALHVGRPNLGDRDALFGRLTAMLDRGWLSNDGPLATEFESRIAKLLDVRHVIATCNATIALEVVTRALGLGGEVIVPSFTFVATAHALEWQGIRPVFCDVDPETHNLDPAAVERAITPRTTGIIGVHLWGRPCDIGALQSVADRHGLRLLFDASHAFGCTAGGRPLGGFGDAEVFSFHATKFVNSGEGGVVTTNDSIVAERVRAMKNFGFVAPDTVASEGTNGKMSELAAAMGLTSLDSADRFVAVNRARHVQYRDELDGFPGLSVIEFDERDNPNYQYLIVDIDSRASLTRDEVHRVLQAEHVMARRYFYPGCHRMEPYRSRLPEAPLPATERLTERLLALPTGTGVTPDDVSSVCRIIRLALAHGPEVRAALGTAS